MPKNFLILLLFLSCGNQKSIYENVVSEDLKSLEVSLSDGSSKDIDFVDEKGMTALTKAVNMEDKNPELSAKMVEKLLNGDASIFPKGALSPFLESIIYSHVNSLKLFLKYRKEEIDINKHYGDLIGGSPFVYVCRSIKHDVKPEIVNLFFEIFENKIDLKVTDHFGRTALHNACMTRSKEVVEILVNKGSNINTFDKEGYSPLYYALDTPLVVGGSDDEREVVEALGPDVNPNLVNGKGDTLLLIFIKEAKDENNAIASIYSLMSIFKDRLDIKVIDKNDKDFMGYALEKRFFKLLNSIANFLVLPHDEMERFEDEIEVTDNNSDLINFVEFVRLKRYGGKYRSIAEAVESKDLVILKWSIKIYGSDINSYDDKGETALIKARLLLFSSDSKPYADEAVKLLLEAGADPK